MAEVGSTFVSVIPSAKGFGKTLDKQVGSDLDKTGKQTGSRFGAAIGSAAKVGLAVGGLAMVGFAKKTIGAASLAQQSLGATQTVFGKFSDSVVRSSDTAAQRYGLSANTYRENANLIGSLFKNQGVATDQLAGKTDNMIGVGADLAATFGGTTTEAVQTLGAAFKGEYDSIERYGISLKESEVSAELARRGQDNLTGSAAKLAKQQVISDLIMRQSKDSIGAFGRESNTLAGQQQRLSAAFENLSAKIGTAFLPLATRVVSAVSGFVTGMQAGTGAGGAFAAVLTTVGSAVSAVVGFLSSHLTTVKSLALALTALVVVTQLHGATLAVSAAGGLAAWIKGTRIAATVTKAWAAVQWVLNAAMAANPLGLVIVVIAALVVGLVIAYKKSQTFRNIVNGAFNAVRGVVSAVVGWFSKYVPKVFSVVVAAVKLYVNTYKRVITAAFNVAKAVVTSVMRNISTAIRGGIAVFTAAVAAVRRFQTATVAAVRGALSAIRDIPGRARDALGNLGGLLVNAGRALIDGLINGISSRINAVRAKMSELASAVRGFLPGSPVKEGPLTSWNNGGAGKRLVGMLADGLGDTRQVDAAMARLSRRVQVAAPSIDGTITGRIGAAGAGANGRVINVYPRTERVEDVANEIIRRDAFAGTA